MPTDAHIKYLLSRIRGYVHLYGIVTYVTVNHPLRTAGITNYRHFGIRTYLWVISSGKIHAELNRPHIGHIFRRNILLWHTKNYRGHLQTTDATVAPLTHSGGINISNEAFPRSRNVFWQLNQQQLSLTCISKNVRGKVSEFPTHISESVNILQMEYNRAANKGRAFWIIPYYFAALTVLVRNSFFRWV